MKSPMITEMPWLLPTELEEPKAVKNRYTDLQVLCSGAGYYIGTMYQELDENDNVIWEEPGSRDSDYFKTQEGAEAYLKILNVGSNEDAADVLRQHP